MKREVLIREENLARLNDPPSPRDAPGTPDGPRAVPVAPYTLTKSRDDDAIEEDPQGLSERPLHVVRHDSKR